MQETASLIIKIDGREIAVGQKSLEDLADAGGRAEKATQGLSASSGQLTAAQRQLAAEARKAAGGLTEAANDALAMDRRVTALRQSYDPLAASIDRTNKELAEAADLYRLGAIAADEYATAQATLQTRLTMLGRAHAEGGKAARLQSYEMVNLGRQFGDVATMAALGASPMMILSTQGLQIAEIFGVARERGVGFGAALGQVGGAAGSLVARFLPVGAAIGAVVGAFALFEREVDKSTEGATTWGQTWQATLNVVGGYIMDGPVGTALSWLGREFARVMDLIGNLAFEGVARVVGGFIGAYRAIQQTWRQFPAAFGDLISMGVNRALSAVEDLINGAINALNNFTASIPGLAIPPIPPADLDRFKAPITGAAAEVGNTFRSEILGSVEDVRDGLRGVFADIVAETERLAAASEDAAESGSKHARAAREQAAAVASLSPAVEKAIQNLETLRQRNADLTMSPVQKAMAEQRQMMRDAEASGVADLISATRFLTDVEVERARVTQAANVELRTMPDSIKELVFETDDWLDKMNEIIRAYGEAQWATETLYRGLHEKDWGQALAGLVRVIEQVKKAFGEAGTMADKIGAVAGIANVAGQAIGGKGGSALSGAASGAMAGAAFGPWGAAIGAALGGLGGILGYDSQRKQEKAQQEAADIARTLAAAQEQANRQASLEIELLRMSGDEAGALAKERERELSAMDRTSAAIQRQINALEDWKAAVSKAEAALSQAEADLRTVYDREMAALQKVIDDADVPGKRRQLEDAYQREVSAIEAAVQGVDSLIESLGAFRRELDLNPLAMSSPLANRDAALAQFRSAAPDNLIGAGRTFLDASASSARTAQEFQRDRALVARAIEEAAATGQAQLTEAERQIQLLDAQVAGILAVNDNAITIEEAIRQLVTAEQAAEAAAADQKLLTDQFNVLLKIDASIMSWADAVRNFAAATQALADAQKAKPDPAGMGPTFEAVGWEGYVQKNPDLAALYASGEGMARGRSLVEFAQYHWGRYGSGEDRYFRPFARGGMFGPGGVVNGPTAFPMGLAGEAGPEAILPLANVGGKVGVMAANDGLREEMRALSARMDRLIAVTEETARNTRDSRDVLEGAARGQLSLSTEAA